MKTAVHAPADYVDSLEFAMHIGNVIPGVLDVEHPSKHFHGTALSTHTTSVCVTNREVLLRFFGTQI